MRARGFSLIELVIAVAVSSVVVAAAVTLLLATQRSFHGGVDERAAQETARVALDEITRSLRTAGYGLEPTFAFDFGQANTIMDRLPNGAQARFGGFHCKTGEEVVCRDSIAGPDELVFYARDPTWGHDLTGPVGPGSITLAGLFKTPLSPGQILQIMCYGVANQWLWAYVTVDKVDASNPAAVQVTLAANTGEANDFPFQNDLVANQPCFASGLRRAFKIDRYRYFVSAADETGKVQPWGTPGARPYLMLDQGLSDANGPIRSVIAPDVEDLQVAYVFPLADAATGQQLVGATSGTAIAASAAGIDLAPALGIPALSTPTLDPLRTTHHPANVRAVRVALTVRTPRSDPGVRDASVPAALNRPAVAGEAGYRRQVFETTTYTHNLENKLPVFPAYDQSYTASCTPAAGSCGGG